MQHRPSLALAVAALVSGAIALSGCGILEPTRDAEGRVTEPRNMVATQLRVGDCFSFVDDADLSIVTVAPCELPHTHIVLGQGELTQTRIGLADGDLQVALSLACADTFETHRANAPQGVRLEQEFLVAMLDKPGGQVAAYSCVATDGAPDGAG